MINQVNVLIVLQVNIHRLMDLNHAKIVMLVHLMVELVKGYVYHVVYAPMDNTQVLVQPHVLHVHQVDLYQI